MDCSEVEDSLRVIDSSIAQMKWRLRPSSKSRLVLDILMLSTGLRPTVMVDYGGHGSELQECLCRLLNLIQKITLSLKHFDAADSYKTILNRPFHFMTADTIEDHMGSSIFEPLRVMIIQDMIYLVHIRGLAEHALSSLSSEQKLLFVDLDQEAPKMIVQNEREITSLQFKSIQKLIFSLLSVHELNKDLLVGVSPCIGTEPLGNVKVDLSGHQEFVATKVPGFIDLSSCMQDLQITLPTLNGWILGYPVTYLFTMDHIADAISNLSAKSLHIYMILVCRNGVSMKERFQEVMRFKFLSLPSFLVNKVFNPLRVFLKLFIAVHGSHNVYYLQQKHCLNSNMLF